MREDRRSKRWWLIGWIAFEFIALLLALVSTGAGHGDYLFCKLLFPIPMYIGILQESLGCLPLLLSFIQYPIVGLIPYTTLNKRHRKYFYAFFVLLNVLFIILVFMHPSEQFG